MRGIDKSLLVFNFQVIYVAPGGAGLLDEVERSGTRRVQTARAWPRAAQQSFKHYMRGLPNLFSFGWLFFKSNTKRVICPRIGISKNAMNHADLFVSCNRLAMSENAGTEDAMKYINSNIITQRWNVVADAYVSLHGSPNIWPIWLNSVYLFSSNTVVGSTK